LHFPIYAAPPISFWGLARDKLVVFRLAPTSGGAWIKGEAVFSRGRDAKSCCPVPLPLCHCRLSREILKITRQPARNGTGGDAGTAQSEKTRARSLTKIDLPWAAYISAPEGVRARIVPRIVSLASCSPAGWPFSRAPLARNHEEGKQGGYARRRGNRRDTHPLLVVGGVRESGEERRIVVRRERRILEEGRLEWGVRVRSPLRETPQGEASFFAIERESESESYIAAPNGERWMKARLPAGGGDERRALFLRERERKGAI